MIRITPYKPSDFEGVRTLWNEVFPNDPSWNRAEVAVPEKVAFQPDLLLVAEDSGNVIGTANVGYDGHRGWLYGISVKPSQQRSGVGTLLLIEAEAKLKALGCRKINLQIRADNEAVAAFYRFHGYEVEDRISMGKRLVED